MPPGSARGPRNGHPGASHLARAAVSTSVGRNTLGGHHHPAAAGRARPGAAGGRRPGHRPPASGAWRGQRQCGQSAIWPTRIAVAKDNFSSPRSAVPSVASPRSRGPVEGGDLGEGPPSRDPGTGPEQEDVEPPRHVRAVGGVAELPGQRRHDDGARPVPNRLGTVFRGGATGESANVPCSSSPSSTPGWCNRRAGRSDVILHCRPRRRRLPRRATRDEEPCSALTTACPRPPRPPGLPGDARKRRATKCAHLSSRHVHTPTPTPWRSPLAAEFHDADAAGPRAPAARREPPRPPGVGGRRRPRRADVAQVGATWWPVTRQIALPTSSATSSRRRVRRRRGGRGPCRSINDAGEDVDGPAGPAVGEGHEDHLVAAERIAVPRAVLADERALAEFVAQAPARGKGRARARRCARDGVVGLDRFRDHVGPRGLQRVSTVWP